MRKRTEILEEMPDDEEAERNYARAQVDVSQLVLEVLLDVRDLLDKQAKAKK